MELMNQLVDYFEQSQLKKDLPEIRPGQTVRIHQKIKEGEKERTQVFEGIVIKKSSGSGVGKTFTVRKIVEGIGVEKTFPFHSPTLVKIETKKTAKVRRAKLYYLRGRTGKAAKLYEHSSEGALKPKK